MPEGHEKWGGASEGGLNIIVPHGCKTTVMGSLARQTLYFLFYADGGPHEKENKGSGMRD